MLFFYCSQFGFKFNSLVIFLSKVLLNIFIIKHVVNDFLGWHQNLLSMSEFQDKGIALQLFPIFFENYNYYAHTEFYQMNYLSKKMFLIFFSFLFTLIGKSGGSKQKSPNRLYFCGLPLQLIQPIFS